MNKDIIDGLLADAEMRRAQAEAAETARLKALFVEHSPELFIEIEPDDPWPGWFILVNGRFGAQYCVELLPEDVDC